MKSLSRYISKVLYILDGSRKKLIWLLLAFVSSSVLEALGVGLIGPFISIATDPDVARRQPALQSLLSRFDLQTDNAIIVASAIFVIGVFCLKSLTYFLCKVYIYRFGFRQKVELESRLIHTYLHIPYLFHLNRNSASLVKNIVVEANQFTQNCLIPLLEIVANVVVVIVLFGLLAKTDLTLLAFSLATLLPMILLFTRLSRRARKWGQIKSESQQRIIRAINHGIGGFKETKIVGCEDYFEQDLRINSQRLAKASILMSSFKIFPRISIEAILVIFLIGIIAISQVFWADTAEQFASVMGIFGIASLRMVPVTSQTLDAVVRMRSASYALNMLYSDLKEIENYADRPSDRPSTVDPNSLSAAGATTALSRFSYGNSPHPKQYDISLKHLSFTYPNVSEPAIQDMSLSFRKGESIAFVGKSGAGKTTLVDLLLGLITPDEGDICLNGVSIYKDIRGWQDLVGYIPQSIFLTDETIEQNIAFGVPPEQIDQAQLQTAIKAAQLEELIQDLPNGINTQVGERGVRLSGGQRQRIGIARALYHQREILVLDEATSALDSETEKLVSTAIDSLAGSKTLIIIAHRISTIENCDRIYVLDKGTLKNSGTYQEIFLSTT
ncbi:MAG: ABC transporter ATP-binding protein [Cyanobacteria bacterium J06635_1]